MPPPDAPKPPFHARARSLAFVDRGAIDALLAPIIPDAHERALVVRCVLDEGPTHHRGANFVLLSLLADLAGPLTPIAQGIPVPMRLPPHVKAHTDSVYPLRLPLGPLERLSNNTADVDAMADCLLDGPPQHALANVIMIALLDALLRKRDATPAAP